MLKNGRGKLSYEGPQDSPGCEVFQPRFHRGQKVGQSVQGLREEWQGSQYSQGENVRMWAESWECGGQSILLTELNSCHLSGKL